MVETAKRTQASRECLAVLAHVDTRAELGDRLLAQPFLGKYAEHTAIFEPVAVDSLPAVRPTLGELERAGKRAAAVILDAQLAPTTAVVQTIGQLIAHRRDLRILVIAPPHAPDWITFLRNLGSPPQLVLVGSDPSVAVLQQWVRALHAPNASRAGRRPPNASAAAGAAVDSDATDGDDSRRRSLDTKLEAVGQLAAGLAHEINTPVQFVNDSFFFLEDAFDEIVDVVDWMRDLAEHGDPLPEELQAALETRLSDPDLVFLLEQAPPAFARVQDGLDRIMRIVHAMREFAPRRNAETPRAADINQAIENTLVVAKSEYKYVAEVDVDLGDIPHVECFIHDINQVLLNLVVNAAQAIDAEKGPGRIQITTQSRGDWVEIAITDDGCGIEPNLADRIFEPFFSTKPVGSGTGQGLPLARAIVENKHSGRLEFESTPGDGTTFFVHLPVHDGAQYAEPARRGRS